MNTGEQIKRMRIRLGMTVASLAAASGLTKGFISQVEWGKSHPSLASLERIASALGVPAGLLIDKSVDEECPEEPDATPTKTVGPNIYLDRPGLTRFTNASRGSHFLAALPAQTMFVSDAAPATRASADSLLLVLSGSVILEQIGTSQRLSKNELCAWSISGPYSIENVSHDVASLLIFLPENCALPERMPILPSTGRTASPAISIFADYYDGPLRLVGMRARRLTPVERK